MGLHQTTKVNLYVAFEILRNDNTYSQNCNP